MLAKHPEIKVVSNQAADWDASKAKAITQTVLKQNPDLCGIVGFWDGMDIGTAAAIKEAGLTGKVFLLPPAAANRRARATWSRAAPSISTSATTCRPRPRHGRP